MTSLIATDSVNLIVGGGTTGLSVARYFHKKSIVYRVYDTRADNTVLQPFKDIDADVSLYCGEFDSEILNGVSRVVLSPGVSRDESVVVAALQKSIPVVSDISVFLENVNKPVIGITGSNGKSTVTTMVGLVAKHSGIDVAVGGNIGTAALDLLDGSGNCSSELYVLELSSFQLESTEKANLAVAVHLNVSPDHLDRHRSMHAYFQAKQKIFFGARSVVFNSNDVLTQPPVVSRVSRYSFGLDRPTETQGACYWFDRTRNKLMQNACELMDKTSVKQGGLHNVENVLALFAIAEAAGLPRGSVEHVAKHFSGLAHRCEFVRELNGVSYINDSKATNIGSAKAALNGFKSDESGLILIAGGVGKGANFDELAGVIASTVRALFTIGEDGPLISSSLDGRVKNQHARSLDEAVVLAQQTAKPGDVVLFSPACASFDMFNNFEHRGECFKKCVLELVA